MLEILLQHPHGMSLKLTELKMFKGKWEGVGMEDRRQSVSITPFILSAICYQFGNLHKSMVLQNLHDLLDPSYYSNLQSEKHGLS